MKVEYIFYILGIVFVFATVAYFSYEYLFSLADEIKTIILFCLVVIFFFAGDFMAERDI